MQCNISSAQIVLFPHSFHQKMSHVSQLKTDVMAHVLNPEILEQIRERGRGKGKEEVAFMTLMIPVFITTCRGMLLLFIEHILKRAWEKLHDGVHDTFLLLFFIAAASRDCFLGAGQTTL